MFSPAFLRAPLRILRILWLLLRCGVLSDWLPSLAPLFERARMADCPDRPGDRLAHALTLLGPGFIKVGQFLSMRSDLLGEEQARDLAKLQDKVPPFPAEEARQAIETELGEKLEKHFSFFDDTPIAAASLAQIHPAITIEGKEVAVKILRPRIERALAGDLSLVHTLAWFAEKVSREARRLRLCRATAELQAVAASELDLRNEAASCVELAHNFADRSDFYVPHIDWRRTARRMLTLERVTAIPARERTTLTQAGVDMLEVVGTAIEIFLLQTLRDGFFHADLHPGNLFVTADGVLIPVDFGIMGRLDLATRRFLLEMLEAFLARDYPRVALIHRRAGYISADISLGEFAMTCRAIAEPIFGKPLREISLASLLGQLFHATRRFNMKTQPQLLLLQKTMVQAESLARLLDDQTNIWEIARALLVTRGDAWINRSRLLHEAAREAAHNAISMAASAPSVLRRLDDVLRHMEETNERRDKTPSVFSLILILFLGLLLGALLLG